MLTLRQGTCHLSMKSLNTWTCQHIQPCGHVTFNGGLWLVQIFLLQIWHIWAILRLFYPWSNFDPGVISIFFSPKTHFQTYIHQFFFIGFLETFHNEDFQKEKNWYRWNTEVTVLKNPILRCLYLIGGGHQVNDQYGPATGKARAFRNGITLDGQPKNKGVRAYFVKLEIFWRNY